MWSFTCLARFAASSMVSVVGVLISLIALAASSSAQETDSDEALVQQRLELMRQRVQQFDVTSRAADIEFPSQLESTPIFRYDDPARGYVAAALWKLGAEGRPLAVVSTELQPKYNGRPRIVYEYLSLTDESFSLDSPDFSWFPPKSAITFQPIPDSPRPSNSERLRLVQMRNEARRFAGHEIVSKERCELRLVPQPIDRYTPSAAERADGAIFILAFGTNPEALLFIESDDEQWHFAFGRMSGASRIVAHLKETEVWRVGSRRSGGREFSASNAAARIPGYDDNGDPLITP